MWKSLSSGTLQEGMPCIYIHLLSCIQKHQPAQEIDEVCQIGADPNRPCGQRLQGSPQTCSIEQRIVCRRARPADTFQVPEKGVATGARGVSLHLRRVPLEARRRRDDVAGGRFTYSSPTDTVLTTRRLANLAHLDWPG